MTKLYSYVVARDFGFAPNPFLGWCTLATCKWRIRKYAQVGHWVLGTGRAQSKHKHSVIFAMQVTETLPFDDYWEDPRFLAKRPVLNGSLVQVMGDNVYHRGPDGEFIQEPSHHSLPDGSANEGNRDDDLKADRVLISDSFYYFGDEAQELPPELLYLRNKGGQGRSVFTGERAQRAIDWLSDYDTGIHGDPSDWAAKMKKWAT